MGEKMEAAAAAASEGVIETKKVAISGFSENLRKKEMERQRVKLEKQGWALKEYNDAGMSGSYAIFSRQMLAGGTVPPKKLKAWHYVAFAVIGLGLVVGMAGGDGDGKKSASSTSASQTARVDLLGADLEAYAKAKKEDRVEVIRSYSSANALPAAMEGDIYNFLSEATYTKNKTVKIAEVLGWAKSEITANGGKFRAPHYNLDSLPGQFSVWDGSHRNLEKLIKKGMNDEDSYKHIETLYNLILSGPGAPYVKLATTFSGKNAFGATVKNTVHAKARLDGTVFEME